MNQDIKKRWITALRSGEYTQGRGALNDGNGHFCCLGVLCELAVAEGVVGPATPTPVDGHGRGSYAYEGNPFTLPNAVMIWAGINYASGMPTPYAPNLDGGDTLANINDIERLSFSGIADILEEHDLL